MVVSSTLVNVSDDAEVRLVSLLAEAAPPDLLGPTFQDDCQRCIDAGEAGPLLDTVVKDSGAIAALLTIEQTEEATAAFALLAALLDRAGGQGPTVQNLIDAVVSASQIPDSEERKITLLSVLYNMRSNPDEKVNLLRRMIELAGVCSSSDRGTSSRDLLAPEQTLGRLLCDPNADSTSAPAAAVTAVVFPGEEPPQPRLVSLLDSWQVQDRRDLYRTVASVLPVTDIRKQRFLLLLVESYTDKDASSAHSVDAAKEAAVGAIRDPVSLFVHQRSMLSLPAIQALGQSNGMLLGLLKIFQEGKLSDYKAFLDSNGGEDAVLKPLGLDAESCMRNMRILSLCSLASDLEEIPYSTIAETLQLPSDSEVESWVIAAVSSGLLQAKMDQLEHTVMVERSVVRQFGPEQWKSLQSRLRLWKQNVGGLLAGLKDSQIGSGGAASTN